MCGDAVNAEVFPFILMRVVQLAVAHHVIRQAV